MKQMARGAMTVLALIGISACVDDPQERINNDDFKKLQALPEVAFLRASPGSTAVYFRLINDFGNGTPTHLTLKEVTGTIRVRQDTTFRRYYTNGDPSPDPSDSAAVPYLDGHLQRWWLFTNNVPGEGNFTIQASNGVETTVRVRVEAADLGALPKQNALPGELITIQAPAFQKFLPDAQVTYLRGAVPAGYPCLVTAGVPGPGCPVGQITSDAARAGTSTSAGTVTNVAADGKSLTFRAANDVQGVIRVTRTVPTHEGLGADFSVLQLATLDTLHTPGYGTKHTLDYVTGFNTDTIVPVGASVTPNGNIDVGTVVNVKLGGLTGSTGTAAGVNPLVFMPNSRVFVGTVEGGLVHTDPLASPVKADGSIDVLLPAHVSPPAGKPTLPVSLTNIAFDYDRTFLFGVAQVASTATQTGNSAGLIVGYVNSTTNTFAAANYLGTNSRATAPQLPIINFFPTGAGNARTIMINDNGAFTGAGDCAMTGTTMNPSIGTNPAHNVAGTLTRTVGGCKIYKLTQDNTRIYDAEVRWAQSVNSDIAVFLLAGTGTTTALIQSGCTIGAKVGTTAGSPATNVTVPTAVVPGCNGVQDAVPTGSAMLSAGGKLANVHTFSAVGGVNVPAAGAGVSVIGSTAQYLVIVWYSSFASAAPPWTSLRLTVR